MPIVLIEKAEKTNLVDRLEIDNDDAMRKIVGHLYELGHRKIAYISGEATSYNTQNITKSFLKALKKYDLQEMKNCYINTSYTFSGGKKAWKSFLIEEGIYSNSPRLQCLSHRSSKHCNKTRL